MSTVPSLIRIVPLYPYRELPLRLECHDRNDHLICYSTTRLGHAGVFLLGGITRQTPPLPIILRSGDVLVMAGRGRKCYHGTWCLSLAGPSVGTGQGRLSWKGFTVTLIGIPRIMEGTLPSHFQPKDDDDPTMKACKQFISNAR
jgi:alkylated DNA repair protein alkB family protein 1